MNKKEGNQQYLLAFISLYLAGIFVRYLIHKLRPGTFSIMTFQIITAKEIFIVCACALLIITEKLNYFKINLGTYIALLVALLTTFLFDIMVKDLGDHIGSAIIFFAIIVFMQYPIKKLKHHI